jgi:hypothetical protein
MIRNSHAEFFKWLPIGRIYSLTGSRTWRELGAAKAGGRVMEAIKGNIWAIPDFTDPVVFSSQGRRSKEGASGSLD